MADVMEDLVLEGAPGPAGMVEDPLAGQRVDDTVAIDHWAGASDGPDSTRLAGVGIGLILSLGLSAQRLAAGRPWWEVAVFVAYGLPLCCFAFMMVLAKLAGERSHLSRQQSAQAPPEEVLRPEKLVLVQSPPVPS